MSTMGNCFKFGEQWKSEPNFGHGNLVVLKSLVQSCIQPNLYANCPDLRHPPIHWHWSVCAGLLLVTVWLAGQELSQWKFMIVSVFVTLYLFFLHRKFNFHTLPPEDDEDYIDMGASVLDFYSSLVDLLGKSAPEAEAIKAGRSDSLRARAILRSLVSMEDLEGVLALRFILPLYTPSEEEGEPM